MPRKAGVPNKITSVIKERLAIILNEAMDSIDVEKLTLAERLKLIQIGLTYVIPRLKQVENVEEEMPRNFQIEIIDRLSKKTDKELDEAIKG
ncbi:MAG: hypothetical protein H8E55_47910 [Pelagibacterales bacterium]|nr:hypothetical protein [Pelagibacterales bacterium]